MLLGFLQKGQKWKQKEDQERESEKASEESRDKMAKEKATAEDMRNKAMERLSETKKRAGSDLPKKKRKHNGNDSGILKRGIRWRM